MTEEQAREFIREQDTEKAADMMGSDMARQEADEARWRAEATEEREFMKRSRALEAALQISGMNGSDASAYVVVEDAETILAFLTAKPEPTQAH